ncbi:MAG: metal ABC transporter substrate-binding protein [Nocardioides sp.]
MRLLPRALAGLAVAAPLLVGCGATSGGSGDGLQVVAAFYPLEYVAQRVAGDHADVQSLATPGAEPHDLELTIAQTAAVADADVLVLSTGFQPAVDDTVEQNARGRVVDAADVADLETPSGGQDPHFWLDPTRLAAVADDVEQALAAADPDHAGDYEANLAALKSDLGNLDHEFETGLADCARDTIVVSHDAFGYLADRYGLHVEAINGISPDAEPSPAHLRELSRLVEARGITTVFSETLASPELAQTLAGDLGLKTAVLDPVEGLTDATEDQDYLSLMRENLAALQDANGCR